MNKEYIIPVAGTDYEQSTLVSLMTEKNPVYLYSKKELLENIDHADEKRIYEYSVEVCELRVRHDPTDPDNPGALKVYADGKMIGYVPLGYLENLMKLSQVPGIEMSVEVCGGPYKFLEWDEEADTMKEKLPEYYKLFRTKDTFKANMVFRWE